MIDTLIGALKLSLNRCNELEDSVDYIYEINQVLNRFKTNLFKLIPDKDKHIYDPKELIQIRISANWKTSPTWTGDIILKERSPVLLHVSGFIPELGLRKNKERQFIKTVDISDIISLEKIIRIKTDYYRNQQDLRSEVNLIESRKGEGTTCILYTREALINAINDFTLQISGMVHHSVDVDYRNVYDPADKASKNNKFIELGRLAGIKSATSKALQLQ